MRQFQTFSGASLFHSSALLVARALVPFSGVSLLLILQILDLKWFHPSSGFFEKVLKFVAEGQKNLLFCFWNLLWASCTVYHVLNNLYRPSSKRPLLLRSFSHRPIPARITRKRRTWKSCGLKQILAFS